MDEPGANSNSFATSYPYLELSKRETLTSCNKEIKSRAVFLDLSVRSHLATNLHNSPLKLNTFRASQRQISLNNAEYYQRINNYNLYLKNKSGIWTENCSAAIWFPQELKATLLNAIQCLVCIRDADCVLYELGNEVLCIMWMHVYPPAVTYILIQTEFLSMKKLSTSTTKTD
jgi:hypothetical protein